MKLIIVIPDGMGDLRYPELDNLSPAEYADTPGLDEIVRRGQVGLAQTMIDGLPLGSLVGILGLLGYPPLDYFPLGRSIFEARALGIPLADQDVVFRCNIVRVDRYQRLVDFTAGQISETEARDYLATVKLAAPFELYHDLSYRNVLIWRDCPLPAHEMALMEPHESVGQMIDSLLPRYRNRIHMPLTHLMRTSYCQGLMLWPWGPSQAATIPPVSYRLTMVTALSFVSGLTQSVGGQVIIPVGATGYLNSDLAAKCAALIGQLPELDVGIIHCNAPDEEAHVQSLPGKIQAIEAIDRLVISPLLHHLDTLAEPYRLLICPDHYTCCLDGRHRPDPVPFAVCGHQLTPNHHLCGYSETAINRASTGTIKSYDLIPQLSGYRSSAG